MLKMETQDNVSARPHLSQMHTTNYMPFTRKKRGFFDKNSEPIGAAAPIAPPLFKSAIVWNGCMTSLSEVRRQIVPDLKSNCTEDSVAHIDARPTDEKRTSVSRISTTYK